VPRIIYDSISAAESALTKVGLKYTLSNSTNTGVIFSQTPDGGSSAKCGSNVDLGVASNPVKVPNVIGKTIAAAETALQDAGLRYSLNQSKGVGTIDSQTPKANTSVASGSNVDIDASGTGTSNACTTAGGGCITSATAVADQDSGDTVKHLAEDSTCAAITAGTECWQVISNNNGNACTTAGGKCITSKQAGTDSGNMTVTHLGTDDSSCPNYPTNLCYTEVANANTTTKVTVPGVVGDSVSAAETALQNAGLKYTINISKGTGAIDSQTPAAKASVAKGSNVDIDASGTGGNSACVGGGCITSATAVADQNSGDTVKHIGGAGDTACGKVMSGGECWQVTKTGGTSTSSVSGSSSVFSQAVDATASVFTGIWNAITSPFTGK
jgi:beta-lactam-binding protein with PASTA domain